MTTDDREVLCALLDREDVDPDVLARVLDHHENRALLIDFARVRAALHVDEPMEPETERTGRQGPSLRRPLPRGLTRAAAVLAVVAVSLAGGAWYARHALADAVPEPSRIVQLAPVDGR